MKLSQYHADQIAPNLPKGVTASTKLVITLKAKCSACGEVHELEEETDTRYNAPFAVQHRMKFTTVTTSRDQRSTFPAEFLLCFDCNRIAQDFMQGKITLPNVREEA